MINHYNYLNYQFEKIKGLRDCLLEIFNKNKVKSFIDMVDGENSIAVNFPAGFQGNKRFIEFWYIATHFLLFYSDFKSFYRCVQYSKVSVWILNDIEDLVKDCDDLTNKIINANFNGVNLDKVLNTNFGPNQFFPINFFLSASRKWDNPEDFFHDTVKCHSFMNFFDHFPVTGNLFNASSRYVNDLSGRLINFWNDPFFENSETNNQLLNKGRLFSRNAVFFRDQVYFYLKNYFSSLLLNIEQFKTFKSPAWDVLDGFDNFKTTIASFLSLLHSDDSQNTQQIINKIFAGIKENTYPDCISGFFENQGLPGLFNDKSVFSQFNGIDLIPGAGTGNGARILLAFSSDKSKKLRLPLKNILRRVRLHLIDCLDVTKVVLIVCDKWNIKNIKESLEDLHSWKNRGVHFLFLDVSQENVYMLPPKIFF